MNSLFGFRQVLTLICRHDGQCPIMMYVVNQHNSSWRELTSNDENKREERGKELKNYFSTLLYACKRPNMSMLLTRYAPVTTVMNGQSRVAIRSRHRCHNVRRVVHQ